MSREVGYVCQVSLEHLGLMPPLTSLNIHTHTQTHTGQEKDWKEVISIGKGRLIFCHYLSDECSVASLSRCSVQFTTFVTTLFIFYIKTSRFATHII